MERSEQAGIGVAVVGHVLLFAALSLSLMSPPELPKITSDPVEVELIDDVALQSAAPMPSVAPAPAPASAQESVVQETSPPTPLPPPPPLPKVEQTPAPKPVPKIVTTPAPKPVPKAPPRPVPKLVAPVPVAKLTAKSAAKPPLKASAPAKPTQTKTATADTRPRRRPGLSRSIVDGLNDAPSKSVSKTSAPGKAVTAAKPVSATTGITAAQMTGPQKSALNGLIYRQLKPFWKPPSGADAELLVTKLSVHLNRDGSIDGEPELLGQEGINDSNRTQAKLHAERAIQAVRRAAPFNLPPDYYEAWKWLKPLKLYVGQPG